MGLSQRVTELLERWLGEGECLPQTRPFVESLPTPSIGLSSTPSVVPVSTTATEIVSANDKRNRVQLHNQSVYPVRIKAYDEVTLEDFNFILAPSSSGNNGDGAPWDSGTIKGVIWGITEIGTANVTVMEEII